MSPQAPRTFHYRACAHAFSGSFSRPFQHQIDIQAPVSLPTIGGHGHNRVENFQFREFVSFKKGYTHVSGAHQADDDSNNTLVTATVEGLNVLDVLTADRVVARLYSKHHRDAAEGEITLVGSKFENLRIAGCLVHVEFDHDLIEEILTFELAKKSFEKKGKFRKAAEDPFKTGDSLTKLNEHGPVLFSCVKDIETDCPGVTRRGRHGFHVRGFGTVFLGEVLLKHGEKTLTMIRLDIGSAVSGKGTVSEASGNGSPYPPTK